jgi:hypothetical protein
MANNFQEKDNFIFQDLRFDSGKPRHLKGNTAISTDMAVFFSTQTSDCAGFFFQSV